MTEATVPGVDSVLTSTGESSAPQWRWHQLAPSVIDCRWSQRPTSQPSSHLHRGHRMPGGSKSVALLSSESMVLAAAIAQRLLELPLVEGYPAIVLLFIHFVSLFPALACLAPRLVVGTILCRPRCRRGVLVVLLIDVALVLPRLLLLSFRLSVPPSDGIDLHAHLGELQAPVGVVGARAPRGSPWGGDGVHQGALSPLLCVFD
mmetsp:Transcript_43325/g.92099  ORF Transcript_43325/g.92099 Transcript_43325/m.92099 type:complete len:204 (+) Transcript_43325:397-1008(+)